MDEEAILANVLKIEHKQSQPETSTNNWTSVTADREMYL